MNDSLCVISVITQFYTLKKKTAFCCYCMPNNNNNAKKSNLIFKLTGEIGIKWD